METTHHGALRWNTRACRARASKGSDGTSARGVRAAQRAPLGEGVARARRAGRGDDASNSAATIVGLETPKPAACYLRSHPSKQARRRAVSVLEGVRVIDASGTRVRVQGVGIVHVRDPVIAPVSSAQIVERRGALWLHVQHGDRWPEPKPAGGKGIGLDAGITHTLTCDDGAHWQRPDTSGLEDEARRVDRHRAKCCHPRVAAMEQATPQGVKVSRQSPPHPRELGAPHGEGHLAGERRRRNRRLENPKHDRVGARNIVDARLAREAGTQPLACAGKTRTAAYRGAPTSLARRDVVCRRRPQEYLHHVFAVRAQGQGKQERSTLQVHEVRVSDPRGPERGNQPETPRTQRARRICQSAGRRGTPSRGRSPRQARIRRQRREGGNASPGGEARIRGVPRPRARPGNDRWRLRRKPVKSPI